VSLNCSIDTFFDRLIDVADPFNVCQTYHGTAAEEAVG
jgi:hypothetical protein